MNDVNLDDSVDICDTEEGGKFGTVGTVIAMQTILVYVCVFRNRCSP